MQTININEFLTQLDNEWNTYGESTFTNGQFTCQFIKFCDTNDDQYIISMNGKTFVASPTPITSGTPIY